MQRLVLAGIILVGTIFSWGNDSNQWKTLALLLTGLAIGIKYLWERCQVAIVLILLAANELLRPEGMSLISLSNYCTIGVFLLLAYYCYQNIEDKWIKSSICLIAVIQALYGLMQVWYDPIFSIQTNSFGYRPPDSWRIFGTVGNRQYWQMFLGASVPLFFYQGIRRKLRYIGLGIVSVAYIASAVVLWQITFVDVGLICLGMIWIIRKTPLLAIPAVITLLICFTLNTSRFSYDIKVLHGGIRWKIATLTYKAMATNKAQMITGYGLGTYKALMPGYEKQPGNQIFPGHILTSAHDEYLQAWFELGIPGLIIMLMAFGFIGYKTLMTVNNLPYWASLFLISLFAWVHFPLHLPFMSLFFLRGKEFAIEPKGFYSGCPIEDKKEVRKNGISRVLRPTEH